MIWVEETKELFSSILEWTKYEDFWVRRKCYSQVEPETVKGYLIDRHTIMPRVAFRYVLEKYDAETRNTLLKL